MDKVQTTYNDAQDQYKAMPKIVTVSAISKKNVQAYS